MKLIPLFSILLTGCSALYGFPEKKPDDASGDGDAPAEVLDDPVSDIDEETGGCDAMVVLIPDTRVTFSAGISSAPSLAWSGSEFGLSWDDGRDSPGGAEIYFVRLSPSGTPAGSEIRVSELDGRSTEPWLLWNGSTFGLAWGDARAYPEEIFFALISSDGTLAGMPAQISDGTVQASYPTLTWTGSEFGVAWHDRRDASANAYFARISRDRSKIGDDVQVSTSGELPSFESPPVVFTGSEYLVAWADNMGGESEIFLARLSAEGSVLEEDIRITDAAEDSEAPVLAWTGSQVGIAWHDRRNSPTSPQVFFALLTPTGNKIGADLLVGGAPEGSLRTSLVWAGDEFGLAWDDQRHGDSEIFMTRIDSLGVEMGDDLRVSNGTDFSSEVSLAWTGSSYGLAWQDRRDTDYEIYFALVGCP